MTITTLIVNNQKTHKFGIFFTFSPQMSFSTKILKKVPRNILILAREKTLINFSDSNIYYESDNIQFDLLIVVDLALRISVKHPFSISSSEIYFTRGTRLTDRIFYNALVHYSRCEIRNGK